MAINLGSNEIKKMSLGNVEIAKISLGGVEVFTTFEGIAGDGNHGFYGEIPTSQFITGNALATAIGLTAGTAINSTQPWLKFALNGKTLYVAKKHFRHTLSWNNINGAGAVYGTKTVAIGGKTYKVRLLKTSLIDPMSDPFDWAEVIGSEWNKLMHPIHVKAGTQNWKRNQGVDPDVPNWGINYTDSDLETNVYTSWCQEKQGTNYVSRGHPSIDFDASSVSSNPPSFASDRGWRPCLELV